MFAKQRAAMEEKWKPAKPGCWDFLVIYPLEAVFNTIVTGLFPLIGLYLAVVIGLHAAGFSDVPVGLITFFAMAVPFYVVFFSLKIALWLLSLVWK